MPGRVRRELAIARTQSCAGRLAALERDLLRTTDRLGPVFKEAFAALDAKLTSVRSRLDAFEEVGRIRQELLWREVEPVLEAVEEGLHDLTRVLRAMPAPGLRRAEELETLYDEIGRAERWFLTRLRHTSGEMVAEGSYRCCGCGAYSRPGAGSLLGRCARCGGNCHHHVSGG